MAGHLTSAERDRIAQLRHQHANRKEICKSLEDAALPRSAVEAATQRHGRQLPRRTGLQQESVRRRRERPLTRKMDDPEINHAVRTDPPPPHWPPGVGSGADCRPVEATGRRPFGFAANDLCLDPAGRGSQALGIHASAARGKRRWRLEKHGSGGRRAVAIVPSVIEEATAAGNDFEGDTVLGPPGTGGLATLVCRKSRLTIVVKVRSKNADHVHDKLKQRLKELDEERRHSVTFDNGTEFARCHRLQHLGIPVILACRSGLSVSKARHERKHQWPNPPVFSQGDRLPRHLPSRGAPGGKTTQQPPPRVSWIPNSRRGFLREKSSCRLRLRLETADGF